MDKASSFTMKIKMILKMNEITTAILIRSGIAVYLILDPSEPWYLHFLDI